MGQENYIVLVCDRCDRTLDSRKDKEALAKSSRWGAISMAGVNVLLCGDCRHALAKFLRGGAVKAVRA